VITAAETFCGGSFYDIVVHCAQIKAVRFVSVKGKTTLLQKKQKK
jgi:hypothetical protein